MTKVSTIFLSALLALPAQAAVYNLVWDIPTADPRITGYEVSWGASPGAYENSQPVTGYETEGTALDLPEGVRYVAVRAVGEEIVDGEPVSLTSAFSNEIMVGAGITPQDLVLDGLIRVPSLTAEATYTLWGDTIAPPVVDGGDTAALELGVLFSADQNLDATGVRFYKAAANIGPHVGSLWSSTGTLLAQATFTGETASGWQEVLFDTPVPLQAGQVYVASYHSPGGHYSIEEGYFTSAYSSGPITALPGDNGVYLYGSGGFPSNAWNSSNYWVTPVCEAQ